MAGRRGFKGIVLTMVLLLALCVTPVIYAQDTGTTDAGDAGTMDAGDAGDAGTVDAGVTDVATTTNAEMITGGQGGGGCSSIPGRGGGSLPIYLLVVCLLVVGRRTSSDSLKFKQRRRIGALWAALVAVMVVSGLGAGSVQAQVPLTGDSKANINLQRFHPTPGPLGVFSTDASGTTGSFQVTGGLLLNFADQPLVLVTDQDRHLEASNQQLASDLLVAVGLPYGLEFGVDLPIYLSTTGEVGGTTFQGSTLGDVRPSLKLALLSNSADTVGLAVVAKGELPTGDDNAFISHGGFGGGAGVVLDKRIGPVLLAFNFDAHLQPEQSFGPLTVGNEFRSGVGAEFAATDDIAIGAELYGSTAINDILGDDNTPVEGLGGVKYRTPFGVEIEAGAGGGLLNGYGAPAYRVFGGLRYTDLNEGGDSDGDGYADSSDACPNRAEDFDSFADEDGCPEPDNDKDGVLDTDDACPQTPGVAENKGCPVSEVAATAEVDTDEDGLSDSVDKCPIEPEDKDNFEDDDGCPDFDNDKDGVLDVADNCPSEPEDRDNFEDDDGCPEPGPGQVVVTAKRIELKGKIHFQSLKPTILPKSQPLLDEITKVILADPSIELIEIQGHTDVAHGTFFCNRLSQSRANAIRKYLIEQRVSEDRILAKGYGKTRPLSLKKGSAENRRVEFHILKRSTSQQATP